MKQNAKKRHRRRSGIASASQQASTISTASPVLHYLLLPTDLQVSIALFLNPSSILSLKLSSHAVLQSLETSTRFWKHCMYKLHTRAVALKPDLYFVDALKHKSKLTMLQEEIAQQKQRQAQLLQSTLTVTQAASSEPPQAKKQKRTTTNKDQQLKQKVKTQLAHSLQQIVNPKVRELVQGIMPIKFLNSLSDSITMLLYFTMAQLQLSLPRFNIHAIAADRTIKLVAAFFDHGKMADVSEVTYTGGGILCDKFLMHTMLDCYCDKIISEQDVIDYVDDIITRDFRGCSVKSSFYYWQTIFVQ